MLYAALTFWLLVIVFCAWGVHALWSGLIKPRAVNTILLPGTLVAQLGHVLGLLITGNQVQNTALMSDDEDGKPAVLLGCRQRLNSLRPLDVVDGVDGNGGGEGRAFSRAAAHLD